MNDKEIKDFISDLNANVNLTSKSDIKLSVKKCQDCDVRVVNLERRFKYGKLEFRVVK